ncbi:desmoplakin-B isoform X3 [Parambassis ranga]|uniref:Desmoplakin-B isoform X3 n=1 Tax=Parambassis ranga TaxID=210632 RepID=A0A6P7ICN7_9TELE|nr:desmoplakin-like isoform X3 [Parambassis ranga]
MSLYGSQQALNTGRRAGSKSDLAGGGSLHYARSDVAHGGGNGYDGYMDGFKTYTYTRSNTVGGGMMSGAMAGGTMSSSQLTAINQRAAILQSQCTEYLNKAEYSIQSGCSPDDAGYYMGLARESIEKLKNCAIDMRQMGQPNDNVVRNLEMYKDQLRGVHMAITGSMKRRRSTRQSSGGWEEPGRSFYDAMGWIAQHKRLIETASWGDDPQAIEQQLISHQKFHSSIQRSPELDRAKDDLGKKGDRGNLHALEQEWDSLQKMSFGRTQQLRELLQIIQEISKEIMWVNDREEEELVFDWGDKNIDQYIPKKQESYSKLMSSLEDKEKELNKLKVRVDTLLKNDHPASDKIEAYKDTLQTQWSWLLQITKCIDSHLKENAAYSQFFKEANETYSTLQKEHESVRKKFTCDKNTSLENLLELLKGLEREREKIMENKRQVQHLVSKSKSIVRLKPRNPEEKSSGIIVKALCDFKQDQKVINKGNEAILKDNSQRSKWQVTGPGGLDMLVPSVCLIIPPPNPLSISLANKNEQYYEAILSIWSQLYINVKSLIAWQYCVQDMNYINSLTITMLAQMRPEEYRQIIKNLETHYEEFKVNSQGSQMFADEDKRSLENQFNGAHAYYNQLVVQLPAYITHQEQIQLQVIEPQPLIIIQPQQQQQQQAIIEEEALRLEEERRRVELRKVVEKKVEVKKEVVNKEQVAKKEVVKVTKTEQPVKRKVQQSSSSSYILSELHSLRLRLEAAEGTLSEHVHICIGDDGVRDCGLKITHLETVQRDIDSMREEYLHLRERILKELEGMSDSDKAQFLRSEVGVINDRLGSLESSSSAYVQRLRALRDVLESVARAEDIVKVHEARLMEKETTSLSPTEVEEYMTILQNLKAELDQKKEVLVSMEAELAKANHWNSQVGGSFHRCDMMLSKYSEQVGLLSDRWRRIQGQVDTRLQDLQLYLPQLQHYRQTSTSLMDWINATRKNQDALHATEIQSIQALMDHINNQKALNTEIKSKRDDVESVLRDNEACVNAIKNYETDLASYTSGLETLLNVPIKRTMLRSPSMDLHEEAVQLQTRYMELLTLSGDYYKFLGEFLKSMEELKIRNTRIDLLEEELRRLRENVQDCNTKNKSLEDVVARYQLELSQSQDQLLSMEEVKQNTALQCSATKESLDTTQSQLADLNDEVARLNYLLSEEKRKTKLAEERYTQQQEEYELVLSKRHKELETVSWSKMEVEKSVANKEHESEQLRRQLDEEAARVKELQKEISKIRASMQSMQSQYNDIVSERDSLLLKLQLTEKDKDTILRLEEELSRIKLSFDSEFRNKQRLQEESERVKRDVSYWKDQCESKQVLIRQYDTDKDILEKEKASLKSEIERLMRELRELEETYKSKLSAIQKELQQVTIVRQTMETELKKSREPPTLDASTVIFDGVRKPVTADMLLDCFVLDKLTFNQLVKGHKTVPEVSADKKVNLKGTGPIAGVIIESPKGPGSVTGPLCKMTFTEAKKENLLPPDSVDLLLDAQAATGHIIDPRTNQKLTVEEACSQGVVDYEDRERLLAAEAAAVGYSGPGAVKPLSVFQAMKKGLIDKNTTLRLLQAQESVGGILDPVLSVFLPKDTAIARDLIDDNIYRVLNQRPELYLDPDTEEGVTYMSMKRRCKVEPHTGLLLLPVPEKVDPSKLVFDGVRKPVTANQLLECGVLDKPTFKDLERGKKTVPEVSVDKNINLKGTGPIAGVVAGSQGKLSLSEAKKQMLLPEDCADLLLEAQAATGHIIDPKTNQKLIVEDACARGVVDVKDRDKLLAAEAAAVGYKDPNVAKPLSVFEAMKKGLIDRKTGLRLLQAQESVGGILDPNLSVFLPKDTAIKRNLLDENLRHALTQTPEFHLDPETDTEISYGALKKRCKIEPHTGLLLLPITERKDPSKLIFDGVRKPVSAQQLLDCGVLDKPTFNQLLKGEKTVPEVSVDKRVFLKGTGSIAGVAAGPSGKISFSEAKKQMLMPPESADLLLEAQAATGHIIDPTSNQKLTVAAACANGVVDNRDRAKLLAAEAAAVGYQDPHSAKPLSVFEAMKKGLVDRKTALRLLQAQESAGGILDPNLSVFLPKDTAIRRNLVDDDLCRALSQSPGCYLDPDTERDVSYGALRNRCRTEPHTGQALLPVTERKDPSKLIFDGVCKPVSAQQLLDCGVLDKPTFNQLLKGEKTVPEVSVDKKVFLKGTGSIAGVAAGPSGKMSFSEAKKQMLMPPESADFLLEAQAATGHIIDPTSNQKLTVAAACANGVVDNKDRAKLLAAEAAAVGYQDPHSAKTLSVFEAMKKGLVDRKTALRLLQAQESAGGILDPNLSVFLPKDTATKRNLVDDDLCRALSQSPGCYLDPDTERDVSYGALRNRCRTEPHTGQVLLPVTERKDPSKLIFEGVRKPVSAQQLLDCGVLDKPTFNQLLKGEKTVPEVSVDKKVFLKGTGSIAGVAAGPLGKMSFTEAKKQNIMSSDSAEMLLSAQVATGHIIDPRTNQKLTVVEACANGVVDNKDRAKLLAAEAAAVGYQDPHSTKTLSVFEAMKKGLVDRMSALRLLQAQESAGGILDPNLSVFLPKDTAIKRNLVDDDLCRALSQSPGCYLDPDTERDVSYGALRNRCRTEPHTGQVLLPVTERKDPSKLIFDGVCKPVSAQQLLDCGVLDKPTFNQLLKGEKTVPEVSVDKKVFLKGTGSIAGVAAGPSGKMSFSEAKKQMLMPPESADLLLEAQAATGHIIDPTSNQKLTVAEACANGVVDNRDRAKLLAAEAAAVGYQDPHLAKTLSVFEAMKKGLVDRKTALRLLQAQESAGGILDPNLSVFLPKDTAIRRNLVDDDLCRALSQSPGCFLDPDTERDVSYGALRNRCRTEPYTGQVLLPVTERKDPSKLIFEGVRKPVSAQQLLDCGVLDKPTFNQLLKGEKTVSDVSVDKKVFLKGTGSIAGVAAGPLGKMSFTEAKKQNIMSSDSAEMLLIAQVATGHIIDPRTNQKLTVKEACAQRVVDKDDETKLFAAEAAAIGYRDPHTGQLLSAGQAMKKGLIDRDTALRVLQAQESVGGILDPVLSVFLPRDVAMSRSLIDENLHQALRQCPECYLDPDTQQPTTYIFLKKKCRADQSTGALLLPEPQKPLTVQGLRGQVSIVDLVDANLLGQSDMDQLNKGKLTSKDIEDRLRLYLRGSACIAGVYDEASDKVLPVYQAMKDGLLRPGTTLELLEAQAASGFIIDPVNNLFLTVNDAHSRRLFGPEFKDKLLAAERAVTGYKLPGTNKIISLFEAIEKGLVEKGHGIRLLEAQIASGGIIDPKHSHRIDVNVAYKRGYFDEEMNKILTDPGDDTKGFFDPNTEENLTYLELKTRCITDKKTGLILLPIKDKKKQESTAKNTLRKRRVVIVDPDTNKEMTVREAYDKGYIDYDTFLELSEQECEWEEITITAPDGSTRFVIIDRKTGRQYDISELLEKRIIDESVLQQYRSHVITLTQFADIITNKTKHASSSSSSVSASRTSAASRTSSATSSTVKTSDTSIPSSLTSSSSVSSSSSSVVSRPLSPTFTKMTTTRTTHVTERSSTFSSVSQDSSSLKHISSVSMTLASPVELGGEQEPVGAIFDTDTVEKISITEALNRGLVDSITAQRLLEAQACTGGIVNPTNGRRLSIQEAARMGIINDDMVTKLKPAQKAYIGFEDVKTKRKMSAAEAMKEMWLPYEAGQRFMEFQVVTGGLYDSEMGCRRTIEDALKMGWLDGRTAQKLQDIKHHTKNLTCPKSKLKISYKEALDNCLVEEDTGVRMLQASSVSSRGISSPYNVCSAPGSTTGSRSGSRRSSRRASLDLGSPSSPTSRYSFGHFTTYSSTK